MGAFAEDSRYVDALQADARILVAHLAGRGDKSLNGAEQQQASLASREDLAKNLTASIASISAAPQEVAKSSAQLATLVEYVDSLSRQAYPANARTIQITHLYSGGRRRGLDQANDDHPFELQVRQLRRVVLWLQGSCSVALICVLALFALAETGRQSMAQLERVREDLRNVRLQLEALPFTAWTSGPAPRATPPPVRPATTLAPTFPAPPPTTELPAAGQKDGPPSPPDPPTREPSNDSAAPGPPSAIVEAKPLYRDFCPQRLHELEALHNGPATPSYARLMPSNTREGATAFRLCSQLYEARLRESLIYIRIYDLNCPFPEILWFQISSGCDEAPKIALRDTILIGENDAVCGAPNAPETARCAGRTSNRHWSRTEIRTAGSVYLITALMLPLLMGFLGGCTFVFRRISAKIADSSLDVRDGLQSVLRVLMAMLLGGLVGVLSSGGEAVNLAGFSMTLAAVAFFVGFSVEPIFAFVESMVKSALAILEQRQSGGNARAGAF